MGSSMQHQTPASLSDWMMWMASQAPTSDEMLDRGDSWSQASMPIDDERQEREE